MSDNENNNQDDLRDALANELEDELMEDELGEISGGLIRFSRAKMRSYQRSFGTRNLGGGGLQMACGETVSTMSTCTKIDTNTNPKRIAAGVGIPEVAITRPVRNFWK